LELAWASLKTHLGAAADTRGMESYTEARRELGLTGEAEKRVLRWLSGRMPGWVQPDHLTALGLLSLVGGGVAYALTPRDLQWLHGVNISLLLNWLGDSLDGTLARFRNRSRPRYGFYVDHLVDGFGAAALLTGLALSGLAHPAAVAPLLVAYLLLNVEIALAAHVTGVFRITRGPIGGTELRMLLVLANLAALVWPRIRVLGLEVGLFDLIAVPASVLVLALVVDAGWRTARRLDALDRSALAEHAGRVDANGPSRRQGAGHGGRHQQRAGRECEAREIEAGHAGEHRGEQAAGRQRAADAEQGAREDEAGALRRDQPDDRAA
jgi:phosphatidylglycerophosphate synthase